MSADPRTIGEDSENLLQVTPHRHPLLHESYFKLTPIDAEDFCP
jgi:hypothetical protein